jgi:hypothetical protein
MKITTTKALMCAALVGLFLIPSSFAKKPPLTLVAFKGNYTGAVTLVSAGSPSTGTATVIFSVPKKGKSATIDYTATFSDGMGGTSVLPAFFTLSSDKTFKTTDLEVGIAGANNAHPGSGTWSQRKRTLTFTATNGDIDLNGTAVLKKDRGRKRQLSITLVSTSTGNAYTFTTTLTARIKKPKK